MNGTLSGYKVDKDLAFVLNAGGRPCGLGIDDIYRLEHKRLIYFTAEGFLKPRPSWGGDTEMKARRTSCLLRHL